MAGGAGPRPEDLDRPLAVAPVLPLEAAGSAVAVASTAAATAALAVEEAASMEEAAATAAEPEEDNPVRKRRLCKAALFPLEGAARFERALAAGKPGKEHL